LIGNRIGKTSNWPDRNVALLATLAGAETFTDIARFGEKELGLLRRFRPCTDGTPSHDRLFATLDAEQFQRCFVAWVASMTGIPEGVIAIYSATVRRSGRKKHDTAPIHMASAFAARQRLVLGQMKVAESPMRSLQSRSCWRCWLSRGHRDDRRHGAPARYRPGNTRQEGRLRPGAQRQPEIAARGRRTTEQKGRDFAETKLTRDTTVDGDHGRIETRTTTVINDVEWLQERHDWPGLKAVVMVESCREANGKTEHEMRFYLTSLVMAAALLGPIVRSHWSIEKQPALGDGHDVLRRRVPRANRPRASECHHHQAHRP
jgi:hypothetical protein